MSLKVKKRKNCSFKCNRLPMKEKNRIIVSIRSDEFNCNRRESDWAKSSTITTENYPKTKIVRTVNCAGGTIQFNSHCCVDARVYL